MADTRPQTGDWQPGQRLLGQDWIEHGYEVDVAMQDDIEDCPICGAINNTCTGRDHFNGTQHP